MNIRPTLKTNRLLLRPFSLNDAPQVQRLAGDYDIAATTLNLPHPYEDGMAEQWIGTHQEEFENGKQVIFAIVEHEQNCLVGAIGLSSIKKNYETAEMGYWVGKPYWNNGYCTEAGIAVLKYGFEALRLNKIYAHHLKHNPASGRVMQKIGMQHEGSLRQHVKKWDKFENIDIYGILQGEFVSI